MQTSQASAAESSPNVSSLGGCRSALERSVWQKVISARGSSDARIPTPGKQQSICPARLIQRNKEAEWQCCVVDRVEDLHLRDNPPRVAEKTAASHFFPQRKRNGSRSRNDRHTSRIMLVGAGCENQSRLFFLTALKALTVRLTSVSSGKHAFAVSCSLSCRSAVLLLSALVERMPAFDFLRP